MPPAGSSPITTYKKANTINPDDYENIKKGQAEAVLGASNEINVKPDLSISDCVTAIESNSSVITGNSIPPGKVHATGATLSDALNMFDDTPATVGQFAGSFKLDTGIASDPNLTLTTLKEGRAILAADNAPNINTISFSLSAIEAVPPGGSSLAPELNGIFANAEFVRVNDAASVNEAVVLHESAAVDEYSMVGGFIAPPEGVSIQEAKALFVAPGEPLPNGLPFLPPWKITTAP